MSTHLSYTTLGDYALSGLTRHRRSVARPLSRHVTPISPHLLVDVSEGSALYSKHELISRGKGSKAAGGTVDSRRLKICLDTSVLNFLFAEDAPDFKRVTEMVLRTIPGTTCSTFQRLSCWKFRTRQMPQSKRRYWTCCASTQFPYSRSTPMTRLSRWQHFKHLANVRRELRIELVNRKLGCLHPLRVVSPLEVEDDE